MRFVRPVKVIDRTTGVEIRTVEGSLREALRRGKSQSAYSGPDGAALVSVVFFSKVGRQSGGRSVTVGMARQAREESDDRWGDYSLPGRQPFDKGHRTDQIVRRARRNAEWWCNNNW